MNFSRQTELQNQYAVPSLLGVPPGWPGSRPCSVFHARSLLGLPRGQNPNEKPVVMNRSERWAGPANSVPIPTSQTIRGVNW